jgi:hypothetical protein
MTEAPRDEKSDTQAIATRGVLGTVSELAEVEPTKADQIRATFGPMADMLDEFEADFVAIREEAGEGVTPELSKRAKRLRLDIAKVRIEAEKLRKAMKHEYLLAGRAIDGTNNVLKWAVSQKEEALEAIEKHAERMEAERIAAVRAEREPLLAPYVEDTAGYDLGNMGDDVWAALLGTKKQAAADAIAAEKAAKKREAAAQKKAAAAPDIERLTVWVDSFALPDFPGDSHPLAVDVLKRFEALGSYARAEIAKLGDDR